MGQNKRYPGHTIENEVNQLDTRPKPVELTAEELDFANHPVTTPANPIVVQAWVRFREATIRPRVEVIAWTDRAVQVRWKPAPWSDAAVTAWVWASAVEPLGPEQERSRW